MKQLNTERPILFGLLLVTLSSALFFWVPDHSDDFFSNQFFIHYGTAILYSIVLFGSYKRKVFSIFSKSMTNSQLMLLMLFNISAFSLNQDLIVFYESADWLSVLIVAENILLLMWVLTKRNLPWLHTFFLMMMPAFLLFHIHQLIIVLPASVYGFLGALFLGIGLLLFVPLFYLIAYVRLLLRWEWTRNKAILFGLSSLFFIAVPVYFVVSWGQLDTRIQSEYLKTDQPYHPTELPTWVSVAQHLDQNWLTEAYLKGDLIYQDYDLFNEFSFRNNFNERKIHDPIITLCQSIHHDPPMDENTRIKILKFLLDKRHQTAERLWRGDDLITERLTTNVELFPDERLTYSEMTLTISNQFKRWNRQEEAVYTFQLPEGGVITSLSLWVNDIEEKAILTTKSKAKEAYDTIVGRERRDPSVIYWMEGNKARIRVFPCTPEEDRKFKVGITAPLWRKDDRLIYESITFEGPDAQDARASINIVTKGVELTSEYAFAREDGFISWSGEYDPEWGFSLPVSPLTPVSFSFGKGHFELREGGISERFYDVQEVYLDLNNRWTQDEYEAVQRIFEGHIVYPHTYNQNLPRFTLFPYQQVKNPGKALIITKGGMPTPNLEDLKGSPFRDQLFANFESSRHRPLVLDIGVSPTAFNQSLKEFGVISHHQISLAQLEDFWDRQQFPDTQRNLDQVLLSRNRLAIERVDESSLPMGSDHLMRLFYYQSIMDQIGNRYFSGDEQQYIEQELTELAAVANIVTPVSSLIVLETQEDYERFDIERNKDSLGNAALNNQGAVPEPHEWALILVGCLLLIKGYFNSRKKLA